MRLDAADAPRAAEAGGDDLVCSRSSKLTDLPRDSMDLQYKCLAELDVRLAVRLSTASKSLQDRFLSLKASDSNLHQAVVRTRSEHVRAALEDAKKHLARSEPSLFVVLWLLACAVAMFGTRGVAAYSLLDIYPCFVLAYSVSVFSRPWPPKTARMILLIFDFSLSYSGNIFITLQMSSSHTNMALVIALTSTVHALVLSIWMMSVSVQTSPWKDVGGWFQAAQSLLMLVFYVTLTSYYEGVPGVWKLSSACCRLFMLVHVSWTWIVQKVHDDDSDDDQANDAVEADNGVADGVNNHGPAIEPGDEGAN